jgi:hypothetical protein
LNVAAIEVPLKEAVTNPASNKQVHLMQFIVTAPFAQFSSTSSRKHQPRTRIAHLM